MKIAVLLSSFNGSKFISEQIDSILKQKGVDVTLFVRDDGSTDDTLDILTRYENEGKIILFREENIGPAKSFFSLLSKVSEFDWYAFSDQDDVWDEDKLISAIKILQYQDSTKPCLYHSNLDIVDEKLMFYRYSHSIIRNIDNKYCSLWLNEATGCTIVINYIARSLIISHVPKYTIMHDAWIYMVCKIFGIVVYDKTSHIKYRQHGTNVVGTSLKRKTAFDNAIRWYRFYSSNHPIYNNILNFYQSFKDILSPDDLILIKQFLQYTKIKNKLKLLTNKNLKTKSMSKNLFFCILVIFNIL